jgi:Ca-activated chloride channel family protein
LLQAAPDDLTVVLPFNAGIINASSVDLWSVKGADQGLLTALENRVAAQSPGGGTNIYAPVAEGLRILKRRGVTDRLPSIILMTDGRSNEGSIDDVKAAIRETGLDSVPVFAITFGDADKSQLQKLADLTHGNVFDGTKDLISAFRRARGNN